jgi:hypothetical protein
MPNTRLQLSTNGAGASQVGTNTFSFPFSLPVRIGDNAEIAVESVTYTVSYYNISSAVGNNVIGYKVSSGASTKSVTIPDGNYNVSDIQAYLQAQMTTNGDTATNITMAVSLNTLGLKVTLLGGYCLDLTSGSLWSNLGYNAGLVVTTSGTSPNVVNISNVTNIQIHLPNIVSGSYVNNQSSDVIYAFPPSGGPGTQAYSAPFQPFFLPVTIRGQIQSLTMTFTDQYQNPINWNSQTVSVNLLVRSEQA